MDNKKLEKVFNMPTESCAEIVPQETYELCENNHPSDQKLSENDQYIDHQIKSVVGAVDEAKDDILNLARITESPRAFEVYSTLLNTKLNALSKLADIEKDKRKRYADTINNTQINIDAQGININDLLSVIEDKNESGP